MGLFGVLFVLLLYRDNVKVLAENANQIGEISTNQPIYYTGQPYCKEITTLVGNQNLTWKRALIATDAYPDEFCSDENGLIPHRKCRGGEWLHVIGNCSGHFATSNITNDLHRMFIKYAVDGVWNYGLLAEISRRIDEYTCIDLHFLSKGLYYMTIEEFIIPLIDHFAETMNNALEILTNLNEECQTFNASSYILGAVNAFFNRVTDKRHNSKMIITSNFVFQMSNPFFDHIIGLGLYKNTNESFKDYSIEKIFMNQSYDDIPMKNLQLAAYVPNYLIDTLSSALNEEDKRNFNVIIVAIRNDKLFNLGKDTEVVSKVIGLSVSGFSNKERTSFHIYSKPLKEIISDDNLDNGEWVTVNSDNKYLNNELETKCYYPPITYMFLYDRAELNQSCKKSDKFPYAKFSVCESKSSSLSLHDNKPVFDILSSLSISINYAQPQTVIEGLYKRHHIALKSILLIGCTLSLFGLLATTLTLLLIKNWHKKRMYTIQLEIAMAFETFLFLIDSDISYITYIILYYFILSQFSWMMLIGYTQYIKYVKVFDDSSSNVVRALLIGWLLPALVIIIPISVHPECLYCEFCSAKRSILIFSVIVPTSVIILINITIYLLVMINISKSKAQEYGANISKRRTRVGILLPFMLGITWIFMFALVSPWRGFALAGSYLFHLIAPAQAFVLFIFVVVMDKSTRDKWKSIWDFWVSKWDKKEEVTTMQNRGITTIS